MLALIPLKSSSKARGAFFTSLLLPRPMHLRLCIGRAFCLCLGLPLSLVRCIKFCFLLRFALCAGLLFTSPLLACLNISAARFLILGVLLLSQRALIAQRVLLALLLALL